MRIGLDIGGTKTDAVAIGDNNSLIQRVRIPTGFGPGEVMKTAVTAISRIEELTNTPASRFESIGVGIPGMVDNEIGHVRNAVNLGIEELALGPVLAEQLGAGVCVENDVKAAALGAYHLIGLTGSMGFLNLGTGLAAGLVVDGTLWRGSRGTAGEIGHIPIDLEGQVCGCGQRGCLETVASGSGVSRQWISDDPLPVREMFLKASSGDPQAERVLTSLVEGIAAAVRVLVLTVDVDTVVIGGGLSNLGQDLVNKVYDVLEAWGESSSFIRSLELPLRARLVPKGLPVAAVGAALVGAALPFPASAVS